MNMLDTIHSSPNNSTEYHTGISPLTYVLSAEQRETLLDGLYSFDQSFKQSDVPHEPFSLQEFPTPIFLEDAVLVLQTLTLNSARFLMTMATTLRIKTMIRVFSNP
jgi:hypothetical protein